MTSGVYTRGQTHIYTLEDCIHDIGEIPICDCPCKQKIPINPKYYAKYKKLGYPKFIRGHQGYKSEIHKIYTIEDFIKDIGEIPHCQCDSNDGKGCGNKVNVKLDRKNFMIYKRLGYPKFLVGHSSKGKNNPFLGKTHKPESIEKNKLAHIGISPSEKTRLKQSETTKGIPKTEEHKIKIGKANKNILKSEEHKIKLSEIRIKLLKNSEFKEKMKQSCNTPEWLEAHSGKNNINYGKQANHSKKIFIHLTPFQGERKMHRWEHLYATYLDFNNIKYYYESIYYELNINGKDTTYTPDFYLSEYNEFIEIKGWWRGDALIKSIEFEQNLPYPFKFTILLKKDLQNLGIKL